MNKDNIESIVPLLPMQQSFLWHSLNTRSGSGVIQLCCKLTGIIDINILQTAWDRVIDQHQALRTTVHWKAVKKPLQIVHKKMSSPISFTREVTGTALKHYLTTDIETALDLSQAPAHRFAIFQCNDDSCQIVWSLSHVTLDGWSCALIINDWIAQYTALLNDKPNNVQPSPPLNEYTRWMNSQNRVSLLHYWNNYLPTDKMRKTHQSSALQPLSFGEPATSSISGSLGRVAFSELKDTLRQSGLGLGALLQAALAIAIKSQRDDESVLLSTTVSGRHIDLPKAEERIGMLINVMPVCVTFHGNGSVLDWLKDIQARFFSSLPYSHISASEIQACRPGQHSPFDTLLVLENQPVVSSSDKVQISDFKSGIISDIANTLVVIPSNELHLEWQSRGSLANRADMERKLESLIAMLEQIPTLLSEPLAALDQYVIERVDLPTNDVDLPTTEINNEATQQQTVNDPTHTGVAPIRALERVLTEIWCEVLNREQIDSHASFFDLGGSSFQALQVFEKIEQQLDVKLPATTLFEAPSVEKIATLIESDQPSSWWTTVVEINRSGTKIPLFIPFEQTDMLMYRHLCFELGPDQPVYGLQIAAVSPRDEACLADLVNHIKHIQPEGPYLLAGLSGAGMVAWDIAQRLRQDQRSVAMLALLDTYGPAFPQLLPPMYRLASVARFVLGQMLSIIRRGIELSALTIRTRWDLYRYKATINNFSSNSRTSIVSAVLRTSVASSTSATRSVPKTPKTSAPKSLTTVSTQSEPNLIYHEQVRRDYRLARQFVREVSRGKPKTTQWLNHFVVTMTKWRFRSFNAKMALIVFTQGLLLEYCRNKLSKSGNQVVEKQSVFTALINDTLCVDEDMPQTQRQLDRYRDMYANLQPYDDHVLYCKARQRPPGIVDNPLSGWDELLLNEPAIYTIPGDHSSILKYPNVKVLANVLKKDMERVIQSHEQT